MLINSQNKQNTAKKPFHRGRIAVFCLIFVVFGAFILPHISFADRSEIDRLNSEIEAKRSKIEQLDAEIAKQRAALNSASGRANNLQGNIEELEETKAKLETDINRTEAEIGRAELTIQKLGLEIDQKQDLIDKNSDALAESIRRVNQLEHISIIEKFLGYKTMSEFWSDFELTQKLQKKLHTEVDELLELHKELKEKELNKKTEKDELAQQKNILAGQTEVVKNTTAEKAELLAKTKQEEAVYQQILGQKLAEKKAFEDELLEIESKLHFLIDSDSFPAARRGILGWPLDNIIITQQFGGSQFAKQNPGIYGRPYHPGTDFGTPVGSQVKSVYGGVVKGFDNTDNYPGCNAWGGWVLVEHDNGLSSLYAHLSSILVKPGQRVEKGQVIALSGNTGISTGPHLHLSIYASQGVKIGRYGEYKSGTGCSATNATGPFADLEAYLDPMTYLPNL